MITKEQFIELISEHQSWNKRIDEVGEALNCFIYEADWVEYTSILFDRTIKLLFNEEAVDDISWWMFEKAGRPEMKMWDAEGNEIPTETIEDLWELVKDNQKVNV